MNDNDFYEHLENVKKHIAVIDEIALFLEISHHGYYELSEMRDICAIAQKRISEYKKIGIKSTGINVLITVGHLDEAWDIMPKPYMQCVVGADGRVSKSCLCPGTEEFKTYIAEKYKIVAKIKPDFIWVDDDIRIGNHGVQDACYCENCIKQFNELYGLNETFETLTAAQNGKSELKQKWYEFRVGLYTSVCEIIEKSVHSVDETIKIGIMSTCDFEKTWVEKLEAVKLRPGGGFYSDDMPLGAVHKALDCGRQIANLKTEKTDDIQYEFEDFPYQELDKSFTISRAECSLALANGCKGVAYNVFGRYEYPKMYEFVENNASYWESLEQLCSDKENVGIYCDQNVACVISEMGFPISFNRKKSDVTILTGDMAEKLSDNDVIEILSGGVFLDTECLKNLCERGYSYLCGCKIGR